MWWRIRKNNQKYRFDQDKVEFSKWTLFSWKLKDVSSRPLFYILVNVFVLGIGLSAFDVFSDVFAAWKFYKSSSDPSKDRCDDNSWILGTEAWRPYVFATALFVIQPGLVHGIQWIQDVQLSTFTKIVLLPFILPISAVVGIFLPFYRYLGLMMDHVQWIMTGRPPKQEVDNEANTAKTIESLGEAAPQIIIQTSFIVMLVSHVIRQQRDGSDDCTAGSKVFNSIVWPVISNVISIASLAKGMINHPGSLLKDLNLKPKEAPGSFTLTYALLCVCTVVERLLLFLFPIGSIFSREYVHLAELMVFLCAFQILCRWIAFGNEKYLVAKAWLSFVLPCFHIRENLQETVIYLVLHGLGCQSLIIALFWSWPEVLPIWNTSNMANLRSGLDLTVEVRDGFTLGVFLAIMTLSNLVRMAHIWIGLPSLYGCTVNFPTKSSPSSRTSSFPPWWNKDTGRLNPKSLSDTGHFYSDVWFSSDLTKCFACGFESRDLNDLKGKDQLIHHPECPFQIQELSHPTSGIEADLKDEDSIHKYVHQEGDQLTILDTIILMIPLLLTLLNLIAYWILAEQRCFSYSFYMTFAFVFLISFECLRWFSGSTPMFSLAKVALAFPMFYLLAAGIYYNRKECCNNGLPHRPRNEQSDVYNDIDQPTKLYYWALLTIYAVFSLLAVFWTIFSKCRQIIKRNRKFGRKSNRKWAGFMATVLLVWTLTGWLLCSTIFQDPSRKIMLFARNNKLYHADKMSVLEVGLPNSPPCFDVNFAPGLTEFMSQVYFSTAFNEDKIQDPTEEQPPEMLVCESVVDEVITCFDPLKPIESLARIQLTDGLWSGFESIHIEGSLFLLLGGFGYDLDWNSGPKNKTLFVDLNQSNRTFNLDTLDLPEPRFSHCATRVNSTTAILIGGGLDFIDYGYGTYNPVNSTIFLDIPSQTWHQGPEMIQSKGKIMSSSGYVSQTMDCAGSNENGNDIVLVVGWTTNYTTLSAELWTPQPYPNGQWIQVSDVPCIADWTQLNEFNQPLTTVEMFSFGNWRDDVHYDFYILVTSCTDGSQIIGLDAGSRKWRIVTKLGNDLGRLFGSFPIASKPSYMLSNLTFDENFNQHHIKFENDKLLIIGGYHQNHTEVINVGDAMSCQPNKDFAGALAKTDVPQRAMATGGVLGSDNVIVCGGYSSIGSAKPLPTCYVFQHQVETGIERIELQMVHSRRESASIVINDTTIFVTGGLSSEMGATSSTEYINVKTNTSTKGAPLPAPLKNHCMTKINDTTAILIGGYFDSPWPLSTYFFNVLEDSWTTGPNLTLARVEASCGVIQDSTIADYVMVVVVGGIVNVEMENTTEILFLDPDSSQGESSWTIGPPLPDSQASASLVPTSDGKNLILVGGSKYISFNGVETLVSDMYKFGCTRLECSWQKMIESLESPRRNALAMRVPDTFVNCQSLEDTDSLGITFITLGTVTIVAYFISMFLMR